MGELRRIELRAPAKINFGLRVVGRRPDGYHELESLFLPLDLSDRVTLEVGPGRGVDFTLRAPVAGVPADATNLAVRAARGFLERVPEACRVAIQLEKEIPAGAGLGGGSSDAATVLRGLSELFPGCVGEQELSSLALSLGADVPYFLDPRPARVSGIGEKIEALGGIQPLHLLLVNPGTPLATAEVFRAYDALTAALTPSESRSTLPALSGAGTARYPAEDRKALGISLGSVGAPLENDLEPAAVRLCPSIARLRVALGAAGVEIVGMSGSGPTLFGVFEDADGLDAALARADLRDPVWVRRAQSLGSPG